MRIGTGYWGVGDRGSSEGWCDSMRLDVWFVGVKDVRHGAEGNVGFEKWGRVAGFRTLVFAEGNGEGKGKLS